MSHSILRYFKSSQPTAEETGLTSREVGAANKAVQKVIENVSAGASLRGRQKRKYTTTFTAEDRAKIGRYAAENGYLAAQKRFKSDYDIGESTVRLFKKKYLDAVKGSNAGGLRSVEVDALPAAKRGRRVLLGVELDEAVQSYIKQLHKKGSGIGSRIVIAGAQGIISVRDRTLLAENGGPLLLTKDWALFSS